MLFAAVDGSIGLVASLPASLYKWAAQLQDCLRKVRFGGGGGSRAGGGAGEHRHKVAPYLGH